MSWLDKLLEAAEDEVTDVIDKAIDSKDAQGIEDVNQAGTEVLDAGVSDDPNKLVYDKVQTYSQTTDIGDEGVAGTVDSERDDTDETVKGGNETPGVTEAFMTRDELDRIYSECVTEVISESKEEINAKFKEKVAAAKEWKAKQLAKLKEKKDKKKAKEVMEAAHIDEMLNDVFSRF